MHDEGNPAVIDFGVFEVDVASGEIRKRGMRVPLQEQPRRILVRLLQNPGELVTREQLRELLWAADTFVDFEHGLNAAVKRLRDALGDSADTPYLIETLPKRGYRWIGPVNVRGAAPLAGASPGEPAPQSAKKSRTSHRWWIVAAAGVLTALAVAAAFINSRRERLAGADGVVQIRGLAVLPFTSLSNEPGQEYLAIGATELLITELSRLRAFEKVIARHSVMRYSGGNIPVTQIARDLEVDAVVTGAIVQVGSRVRMTAQLVDGTTEAVLGAWSDEGDLADVLNVQSNVVRSIAETITIATTPEERARWSKPRRVDPESHDAYLRGLYIWHKRTTDALWQSLPYFQRAVDKDPTNALAQVGLADAYNMLTVYANVRPAEAYPHVRRALDQALANDPGLAAVHASIGWMRFAYEWDWPGAERAFRNALQLNPNDAGTHHWLGLFLVWMARGHEAVAALHRARDLDPFSLIINSNVGTVHYFGGNWEEAVLEFRKAIELDPDFFASRMYLGSIYSHQGRHREGVFELERAVALQPGSWLARGRLGHAYASAGRDGDARGLLAQFREDRERGYVPAYYGAAIHAALGQNDDALEMLEEAFKDRDIFLPFLKTDPLWQTVRQDPRFTNLVQRLRYPPPAEETDHPGR